MLEKGVLPLMLLMQDRNYGGDVVSVVPTYGKWRCGGCRLLVVRGSGSQEKSGVLCARGSLQLLTDLCEQVVHSTKNILLHLKIRH